MNWVNNADPIHGVRVTSFTARTTAGYYNFREPHEGYRVSVHYATNWHVRCFLEQGAHLHQIDWLTCPTWKEARSAVLFFMRHYRLPSTKPTPFTVAASLLVQT